MRRLLLYIFLAFPLLSPAQIQVADTSTLAQAVESLVSDGVQISNITSNCHSSAWGTFLDTTGYLGIDEGLVLASGSIFDVPGPNNAPGAGQDLMTPGDADLNGIVGASTQDACYIQFDVRPSADTLVFNYVFGSEEYDEFVCSNFNDVFAFLISGPGITGKKNIALIPGSSTPVSINNVNQGNPNNPACNPTNPNYFATNPPNSPELQYDGRTVLLQAITPVIPCETYTLKLAVADVSDGILDSGVFIEKGSLGSFGAEITPSSAYARFSYGVEGCNAGKFIFIRTIADTFEVPLRWDLSGSATNGIDYVDSLGNPLGNVDTIPAFQDSLEILVYPILDTVDDPIETIILTLFDPCDDTTQLPTGDTVTLLLREEFVYNAGPDDSICIGEFIELNSDFFDGDSVLWTPPTALSCTDCPNPMANPQSDITYILRVFDSATNCPASDSINVKVYEYPDPSIFSVSDSTNAVCQGMTAVLYSGLENDPLYEYYEFEWDTVNTFMTDRDTSIIRVRSNQSNYYPLTVTNLIGCQSRDSILITVFPWPEGEFPEDLEICYGQQFITEPDLTFYPGVGYSYSWEVASNASLNDLQDTTLAQTAITPENAGVNRYTLIITNGICESQAELKVDVAEEILVSYENEDLGDFIKVPKVVDFENTTELAFKYDYFWVITNSRTGISDTIFEENLSYEFGQPDLFKVSLYAVEPLRNCVEFYDEDFQFEKVIRPNTITPNGDGLNDYFEIEAPSSQVWELEIYDRNGGLIYSSSDYQNDWDGEGRSAGIFYYVMKRVDEEEKYVGYVQLIR